MIVPRPSPSSLRRWRTDWKVNRSAKAESLDREIGANQRSAGPLVFAGDVWRDSADIADVYGHEPEVNLAISKPTPRHAETSPAGCHDALVDMALSPGAHHHLGGPERRRYRYGASASRRM